MTIKASVSVLFLLITLLYGSAKSCAADIIEGDMVGNITHYTVKPKDTLYKIAHQFDVGIVELLSANPGIDPWLPQPGIDLILPTEHVLPIMERRGIVINLSEMRLFYFPDPYTVITFPIGIGRDGWETVTGVTIVTKKREHPTWTPPDSIREEDPSLPEVVPAGPNNPLGDYALNLGFPGYLIHGTNQPDSIGKRSSHGCIRLYPEDIATLFSMVEEGTPVAIIDTPYKLGWRHDTLFLEVTPSQQQSDEIMHKRSMEIVDIPELYTEIESLASAENVDWSAVHSAVMWRRGIPVAIATRTRIISR